MQEFAILAGLPGSGKSTLALRLKTKGGYFVVSSDMIRLSLNGGVYPRGDQRGDYSLLDPIVWKLADLAVVELLHAGQNVAVDATNLTRLRRGHWRDLAVSVVPGIAVTIWWCEGKHDSPARWAQERGHTEDEHWAIRRKLEATVELPAPEEGCAIEYHHAASADRSGPIE